MFRSLAFLLIFCTVILLSPRASADFTSTFDIPNGGVIPFSGPVGNWYLTTVFNGGAATLDTSSAPSSVSLMGYGTGSGSGSSATLEFASIAQAGTVNVDFNFSATSAAGSPSSSAVFTIYVNGVSVDTYSSTITSTATIPVLAGDDLEFYVIGSGGIIPPSGGPPTILTGTAAVTLSNFTFTPVPELGDTAALVGMSTFGLLLLRRRKKN